MGRPIWIYLGVAWGRLRGMPRGRLRGRLRGRP